jgi:hypothetical protein
VKPEGIDIGFWPKGETTLTSASFPVAGTWEDEGATIPLPEMGWAPPGVDDDEGDDDETETTEGAELP